jgi:hypothetical protein
MDTQTPAIREGDGTVAQRNPHALWRQIFGLVLWIGPLAFLAGGPVTAVTALMLGGVTFGDAWKSGIYRRPDADQDGILKRFLNISPMSWGIAMVMLLFVTYPAYLLNRNKLRTIHGTNAYYWATVVLGAIVIAGFVLNLIGVTAPKTK